MFFAKGPIESNDEANAVKPYLEILPYVGFKPVIPQNAAGWRIEPPVSVPRDTMHISAATAAALPPDEPPGTRVLSYTDSKHFRKQNFGWMSP